MMFGMNDGCYTNLQVCHVTCNPSKYTQLFSLSFKALISNMIDTLTPQSAIICTWIYLMTLQTSAITYFF